MGNGGFGTSTEYHDFLPASCTLCHTCGYEKGRGRITVVQHVAQEVVAVTTKLSSSSAAILGAFSDGSVKVWIGSPDKPLSSHSSLQKFDDICCVDIEESSFHGAMQSDTDPMINMCGGTSDGSLQLWEFDMASGLIMPAGRWRAHSQSPVQNQLYAGTSAVAMDEHTIVSGGGDSTVAFWPEAEGKGPRKESQRVHGAHGGAVTAVCHSQLGPSKDFSLTGGEDGIVKAFSPGSECQLPSHAGDSQASAIQSLTLDTHGHRCCTGCADNCLRLWDLAVGRPTLRFHEQNISTFRLSNANTMRGVHATSFDKINGSLITSSHTDGSVCIWDVRSGSGRSASRKPSMKIPHHCEPVISVASHGHFLLAASLDGCATFWDVRETGAMVYQSVLLANSSTEAPVPIETRALASNEHPTTFSKVKSPIKGI